MNLAELVPGAIAVVTHIDGRGSFRRRLMELGVLPGTRIQLVGVAPLGDPFEILVRGASLSIRRAEAVTVQVSAASEEVPQKSYVARAKVLEAADLPATRCARDPA